MFRVRLDLRSVSGGRWIQHARRSRSRCGTSSSRRFRDSFTAGAAASQSIATNLRARRSRCGSTSRASTPSRWSGTIKGLSPEFLDVGRFPQARFKSTSIELSDERVRVRGVLELRGIRHPVELEVTTGPVTTDGDVARELLGTRKHRLASVRPALESGSGRRRRRGRRPRRAARPRRGRAGARWFRTSGAVAPRRSAPAHEPARVLTARPACGPRAARRARAGPAVDSEPPGRSHVATHRSRDLGEEDVQPWLILQEAPRARLATLATRRRVHGRAPPAPGVTGALLGDEPHNQLAPSPGRLLQHGIRAGRRDSARRRRPGRARRRSPGSGERPRRTRWSPSASSTRRAIFR